MTLCLKGHDYKYAAEQMLLLFFPQVRPRYVDEPEGDCVTLTLEDSRALAEISLEGRLYRGESPLPPLPEDELQRVSLIQKHLKLAFFLAAREATGKVPPWGALTGIRPAKIAARLLQETGDRNTAEQRFMDHYFVQPHQAEAAMDAAEAALAVKRTLEPRDIGLYVGIPFCPTRCAYCSFVSHSVEKSMKLVAPYLEALEREIADAGEKAKALGLRVRSFYMGGGTPTTLSAEQLKRLFEALHRAFDLSNLDECTVEAGRPDTVTAEKFAALRSAGVRRVSINPQTMDDRVLEAIGRRHTAAETVEAYHLARAAGFETVNMDLIAGLPGDSPEGFDRSLSQVLALGPENVTVHTLAMKKGSRLRNGQVAVPIGEAVAEMLLTTRAWLRRAGYKPYYLYRQKFTAGNFENTGWTKPGHESPYNICIMEELCTILSLGAGGVTKLVAPQSGRIERICNFKYPYEYNDRVEVLSARKRYIREFMEKYH